MGTLKGRLLLYKGHFDTYEIYFFWRPCVVTMIQNVCLSIYLLVHDSDKRFCAMKSKSFVKVEH